MSIHIVIIPTYASYIHDIRMERANFQTSYKYDILMQTCDFSCKHTNKRTILHTISIHIYTYVLL